MSLRGFLDELLRRGVLKAAAAYGAVAWLLLEALSLVFQNLAAPDWVFKVITVLFLAGFPVACVMAWGFDITSKGVRLVGFRIDTSPDPVAGVAATPSESHAAAGPPTIAVLAFDNLSADPGQEYFSDGIAEDIITDLSKVAELRVIARNSSFAYKGRAVDVKSMASELGARYVLEGSVRKAGERIRVTSQLIDAATGTHVWAERYDRDLTDIFAVQDDLTIRIIEALRIRLSHEKQQELTRPSGISLEAHNLFLRGREQAFLLTEHGNVEARHLLARAIELSPRFAAAQAYVAFTRVDDYIMGRGERPEDSLAKGVAAARQACAMDVENPDALWVMSLALQWNRQLDESLAVVRRCLVVAPNSAEGHLQLANLLYYRGDADESLRTLDRYVQLDPLYPDIALYFRAEAQAALGRYEDAVATLRQRLERNPRSQTSHALLASCYGHLGRMEEARAAWAEVMKIEPGFSLERRRRVLPYRTPEIFERRLDGLRAAGLLPGGAAAG